MRTGCYTIQFQAEDLGAEGLLLEYEATTSQEQVQCSMSVFSHARIEKWTSEQVKEFVRKLGFMDKDRESNQGQQIIHFLHMHQVLL